MIELQPSTRSDEKGVNGGILTIWRTVESEAVGEEVETSLAMI
jgi:hypothetical protein